MLKIGGSNNSVICYAFKHKYLLHYIKFRTLRESTSIFNHTCPKVKRNHKENHLSIQSPNILELTKSYSVFELSLS